MLNWKPETTEIAQPTTASTPARWLDNAVNEGYLLAITFGGQGTSWWPVLKKLSHSPGNLRLIGRARKALEEQNEQDCAVYREGTNILEWLQRPTAVPSEQYLSSSPISQPLILLTQILVLRRAVAHGLSTAFDRGLVTATTGHSQGLLAALLLSEFPRADFDEDRVEDYLKYAAAQGRAMELSTRGLRQATWPEDATPMLSVEGLRKEELSHIFQADSRFDDLDVGLVNGLESCVVSGDPSKLQALAGQLEELIARKSERSGPLFVGGRPLRPTEIHTTFLPVSAPFHSRAMRRGQEQLLGEDQQSTLPFEVDRLKMPVFSCFDGSDLRKSSDLAQDVVSSQFSHAVDWPAACRAMKDYADIRSVLDVGPGEFTCKMTAQAMRGWRCEAHSIASAERQEALFARPVGDLEPPVDYRTYRPVLEQDGDDGVRLRNRYTMATGRDPVILAGMTPTTADVPIVAATANAGLTAELAGGGQVNSTIFRERCRELEEVLDTGASVVFNALYLDRYLWNLHISESAELLRAKSKGAPFCGVTISAGIPEVDEAVGLLDTFERHGLWLNAFKPGTVAQIDRVLAIADAAPDHTVSVHVEGGQAGGHHSWESLDDLLLARYGELRQRENILLCVGGGIGTEDKAAAYLLGHWARPYGVADMPVDAVLVGTAAMATKEALTSDAVKQALAEADGTDGWVGRDQVVDECTSGRSSLNADIHYLESRAARCSRFLDEVVSSEQLDDRREEVIDALNRTSRPYFGSISEMPIQQVLNRMVDLMATGDHGRYDDGAWKDITWRERVFDLIWRLESRYENHRRLSEDRELTTLADLDAPGELLDTLAEQYPCWLEEPMTGADQTYFLEDICARPGKPIPFVPVIDENIRRWFRSDSLQDSHDDRYGADEVFTIPGPASVGGIERADEPVADLLGRFVAAVEREVMTHRLPARPHRLRRRRDVLLSREIGGWKQAGNHAWTRSSSSGETPMELFASITLRWVGPLAALLDAATIQVAGREKKNPLRNMIQPGATATLRAELGEGRRLTSLQWNASSQGDESVTLSLNDDGSINWSFETNVHEQQFAARIDAERHDAGYTFAISRDDYGQALREFYSAALFNQRPSPAPLFETAKHEGEVESGWADAYSRLLSERHAPLQPNSLFSLALPAIFRTLMADELAHGLLDLVHLTHDIEVGEAWPPREASAYKATARVLELRVDESGTDVHVESNITGDFGLVGTVRSVFHLRGVHVGSDLKRHARYSLNDSVELTSRAAFEVLAEQSWVEVTEERQFTHGMALDIRCDMEFRQTNDLSSAFAGGTLHVNGEPWATIECDETGRFGEHPVELLWNEIRPDTATRCEVTPRTIVDCTRRAPSSMALFAQISGDQNPIHRSAITARLAGIDRPIVHGMWTASVVATVIDEALSSSESVIEAAKGSFSAPLYPGEQIRIRVVRESAHNGRRLCRATAHTVPDTEDNSGSGRLVYEGTVTLRPARSAWVFPGQGIQQASMGMEGFERSAAAREIWERADECTREELGFSILRVVRDNPQQLPVRDRLFVHPKGVLYLTQFTQVAMAVLACAQVAELREAGVFHEGGIACGHSVGEYNALAAVTGVLSLEAVVKLVYKRGLAMDRLVERDENGESPYALGVIRPHYASLSASDAEKLVDGIAEETGLPLEIVNYNVEGRQYSVTGHRDAIELLERRLSARAGAASKPAFVLVPGIDVPFHSRVLSDGVDRFREDLDAEIPRTVDPQMLVDRYIPNLTAQVFQLRREFAEAIVETTGSSIASDILANWETELEAPEVLTRKLLIELLAWQFACPVRWIETQRILFGYGKQPGLAERIVEVGVGYQPTLANMASYSAKLWRQHDTPILNVERDRKHVFFEDSDPKPVIDDPDSEESTSQSTPQNGTEESGAIPRPSPAVASENEQVAFGVADGLRGLLAFQAKVRLDQLQPTDTIESLMGGVSSRRNQVLVDLGEEFNVGAVDGAHELPLQRLAETLSKTAQHYDTFGSYLSKAVEARVSTAFGPANMKMADATDYLKQAWGLDDGSAHHAILQLALHLREGESARGGTLGGATQNITSQADAKSVIDHAVDATANRLGIQWNKPSSQSQATTVDSAALEELREKLLGTDGPLSKAAAALAAQTGQYLTSESLRATLEEPEEPTAAFRPQEAVWFEAAWATAKRDVHRAYFGLLDGTLEKKEAREILQRTSRYDENTAVGETLRYFEDEALSQDDGARNDAFIDLLKDIEERKTPSKAPSSLRPSLHLGVTRELEYKEKPRPIPTDAECAICSGLAERALTRGDEIWTPALKGSLAAAEVHGFDFIGRTALVTGASPQSIGAAMVRRLLAGGATVIVTSSNLTAERRRWYRALYQDSASEGARLCCVPCDLSKRDATKNLVSWLVQPQYRTVNGQRKLEKEPIVPDLIVPFAATPSVGTLIDEQEDVSAFDVMVLSVHRLVASLARYFRANGAPEAPTQLLLPLSPNHGNFGGDGLYGESKSALETLTNRWSSEYDEWGRFFSLINARIGWVRGTGLMEANDSMAALLEQTRNVRTWSADEMGWILSALCTHPFGRLAAKQPLTLDATGGLSQLDDLSETLKRHRNKLEATASYLRAKAELKQRVDAESEAVNKANTTRQDVDAESVLPLPNTRHGEPNITPNWPASKATSDTDLHDMYVVVGYGELGPWGTSNTRHDIEVSEHISDVGVFELAWMTGLIRWEDNNGGTWLDCLRDEPIAEAEIADRFRDKVMNRAGIRPVEYGRVASDGGSLDLLQKIFIEEPLSFEVANKELARAFVAKAPDKSRAFERDGRWTVEMERGATIRVPREQQMSRRFAGQLPTDFSFEQWGIPADMVERTDRLALMNLVATVEAFLSAGLSPEELLSRVHPVRVANTQGAGMGGMESLRRMYHDHLLGDERQNDVLQESLINVVASYVVQSYVGSYGPMTHPVAACATAAVSVEEAWDKLRLDKADFVVAGAFDDIGAEGMIGFGDMSATAETDDVEAAGLRPDEASRPNDKRRRGFVESQGGGTLLITRGSIAKELGLPVHSILGWACSFGDGIQRSVPAPGQGLVAAVSDATPYNLGDALGDYGLNADDIGVIYKHDTSTPANDPNENRLHQEIQERLGRTKGNPLPIVSQKWLTGHPKGGAAAWQSIGLMQAFESGVIPGNRNLENVDPEMKQFSHLLFTDTNLYVPADRLRAGLVTSLGFGHVNALLLFIHPDAFIAALDEEERREWRASVATRNRASREARASMMRGENPLLGVRTERRFEAPDGSRCQEREEVETLLDASSRLDSSGTYVRKSAAE